MRQIFFVASASERISYSAVTRNELVSAISISEQIIYTNKVSEQNLYTRELHNHTIYMIELFSALSSFHFALPPSHSYRALPTVDGTN